MASQSEMSPASAEGARQPVKAHLLRSQNLLVESLYNLPPLLDRILAAGLLSQDNYHEVKAEKTPQKSARKLLEIVQGQMDEIGATRFLECLRKCKHHYPRLQTWLNVEPGISRGPTERRLQAQFSCLCGRLGSSVTPVSLALFSNSTITQFELELIQAPATPTQQTQTLLSICLSKGDAACRSFYTALYNEDELLAEDLNVTSSMEGLLLNCDEVGSVPMAIEESKGAARDDQPCSGVLQQVMARLGVSVDDAAKLNVCELGVALGLPRHTVREFLLEGVSINDSAQVEAVVDLFMEKTKDDERLLGRVAELDIQRVRLSERGVLLLMLLRVAESFLLSRINPGHLHHQDQPHGDGCGGQGTLCTIFRFLLWACLAEAVEEPEPTAGSTAAMIKQLRGGTRVDPALLQELDQCWNEGGPENLLQCGRVLAQILRDLHPADDRLCVSPPVRGLYTCTPGRLHRVTGFQGVPDRMRRKALSGVPSTPNDRTQGEPYRDVCLSVARLLGLVHPEKQDDLSDAPLARVTQHIRLVLTKPAFSSQQFDAGVRQRLLCVTEFNPEELVLRPLVQLHQETLSELRQYLRPGEQHNFLFVLESVKTLGRARLISVDSAGPPVAIDDGMEQAFRFRTSHPGSFLVCLHCVSYEGKDRVEVRKPRCVLISRINEDALGAIKSLGGDVLAQEDDKMWIREAGRGWEELNDTLQRHSDPIQELSCCFKVTGFESECEVRVMYRDGRLWAMTQRACEVL